MTFLVEYSLEAEADVERLFSFLVEKDPRAAEKALNAIIRAMAILEDFPFNGRIADSDNPMLRELVIPFVNAGYVALYAVRRQRITILAIRHQLEDDYL